MYYSQTDKTSRKPRWPLRPSTTCKPGTSSRPSDANAVFDRRARARARARTRARARLALKFLKVNRNPLARFALYSDVTPDFDYYLIKHLRGWLPRDALR